MEASVYFSVRDSFSDVQRLGNHRTHRSRHTCSTAAPNTAPRGSRKEGRNETLPTKSLSNPRDPIVTKREDGDVPEIGTETQKMPFDREQSGLHATAIRFFTIQYKILRRAHFVVRKHGFSRTGSKMRNRIAVDPCPSSQSDLCKIWYYQLSCPIPHLHECPSMT